MSPPVPVENGVNNAPQPKPESTKSITAPRFNSADIVTWFTLLDWCFRTNKITSSEEKFCIATNALDDHAYWDFKDVIADVPAAEPYEYFKAQALKRKGTSNDERIRKLLQREEIGDRKPSEYLRHLRNVAGTTGSDELIRTLWMDGLPVSVQAVVAGCRKEATFEELSDIADRVNGVIQPKPAPRGRVEPIGSPWQDQITNLNYQMAIMQDQMRDLQVSAVDRTERRDEANFGRVQRGRRYDRSNSRNRRRSASRNHYICFYHARFGPNAKKCEQPCAFVSGNAMNGSL